ncbi:MULTISPECIES: cation diffusion facilitator family transporter [Anaerococcus]|uniref:Cation transporter n=1 Tax=Anaerococcus octavius TaxID=54007 RepID=A0A2I1M8G6_9FIRM|nr:MULTISPECIES: cation diffusion facilitator family transporter [Anaerococcus]MDU4026588.1 cation diffusion facilitator family transporter [Anaerococcus sp.]PKZ16412.1 cation transporter [Anaerococcus octavius]
MRKLQDLKKQDENAAEREKQIVKTSVVGIIANVVLAAIKAIVGLASNSIAIILDAVNNISDAGSSLITIVGTKLAAKDPDKEHPFGYGRVEYLSAMIISVIVLYAGITSLVEAIKKIMNPVIPTYTTPSLIIVAVAVVVKVVLGRYVKNVGLKVNSDSLVNSGQEAKLDSIVSASTLVAAAIFISFGLSLEAYLGAIISIIIIKSGIDMIRNTISQLLGERNDPELAREVRKTVEDFPGVEGAYDLVLNNYGPDTWNGSIHIEVPDTYTADKLDQMIRDIQLEVYFKHQIILTAIGVYSINTQDPYVIAMHKKLKEIVFSHKYVTQLHGFYVDKSEKTIRFDVVISLDADDRLKIFEGVVKDVESKFSEYEIEAFPGVDFTGV